MRYPFDPFMCIWSDRHLPTLYIVVIITYGTYHSAIQRAISGPLVRPNDTRYLRAAGSACPGRVTRQQESHYIEVIEIIELQSSKRPELTILESDEPEFCWSLLAPIWRAFAMGPDGWQLAARVERTGST